jgi:hypothetical protein
LTPLLIFTTCFSKIHFNISSHPCLTSQVTFPLWFPKHSSVCIFHTHVNPIVWTLSFCVVHSRVSWTALNCHVDW